VLRESLAEPARYEDEDTVWAVVPAGPERVLAGAQRSLTVSGPLAQVLAPDQAADGEPVAPDLALAGRSSYVETLRERSDAHRC
jgi:hypothetical protein